MYSIGFFFILKFLVMFILFFLLILLLVLLVIFALFISVGLSCFSFLKFKSITLF